jgi:hypothetical protein
MGGRTKERKDGRKGATPVVIGRKKGRKEGRQAGRKEAIDWALLDY